MKDRAEFLESIYAKRDAAVEEQKKKKKRMTAVLSTAAACLVLMVGIAQTDILDFMGTASGEGATDGAAMDSVNEAGNFVSGEVITEDSCTEVLPEDAAQKEDIVTDDFAADLNRIDGDAAAPGQAYYMLPCVTIEDRSVEGEATAMHAAGTEVAEKVQAWVDQLAEKGQVAVITDDLQTETGSLSEDEITCIVTIEREPQQLEVYYLTGDVGWYE